MKKIHLLITIIFLGLSNTFAQNVEFEKDNFPGKKDELNEAKKQIKAGDEKMALGEYYYKQAIPFYLKAEDFNPNNAVLNDKLGQCYLKSPERHKAAGYFDKAYKLNPKCDPKILYYEGYSHQLNLDWDFAIKEYQEYKATLNPKDKENYEATLKRIAECESGKDLVSKPVRAFIDNIGNVVNGSQNEYGPVISADEDVMIFTSRRDGTTGGLKDEGIDEPFEDLYISYMFNGKWTKPVNMGPPINTESHDAVVAISPDGQKLITYKGEKNKGDLYISELQGDKWSKPESLGKPINSDTHEPSATISFDGNTIYFVSDREGGLGGHDIYMCTKDLKGRWGKAVNLGPSINTPYEEEAVFMMADGKTLYFSSQGHNSMGGYDIFKTTIENGIWSKPENIGYPINSPDNDVFFVLAANGKHAYYASANMGGYGGQDIYKITILGPEKQPLLSNEDNLLASLTAPISEVKVEKAVEVKTPKITLLKGVITDEQTKQPLEGTIELIDNTKNEIIAVFKSNSATGKYLVSLPSGKNYGIAVKRDGYLFHSENFDLPATADYQEVNKDVALKKIDIGKAIVLRNIFFDFDKATIRAESANELERLVKLLTDNAGLKIELGSHTDSKGSDEYNMKLSENRSKSVVDYLIGKGISADRLVAKGYGETKPIASNDNEAGRQENRRSEFKIIGK